MVRRVFTMRRFLVGGLLAALGAGLWPAPAPAIQINGYDPARHDRFSSFPDPPVPNTNPQFIGLGYDWSGVGWWSDDIPLGRGTSRAYTLLGGSYFLYARHYPPEIGGTIDFQAADGSVHGYVVESLSGPLPPDSPDPEQPSDLAIGTFAEPVPDDAGIAAYSILFKGYSTASYAGLDLLQYGRHDDVEQSSRIAENEIRSVFEDPDNSEIYYFDFLYDETTPDRTRNLIAGDSGSPSFVVTGAPGEMYLVGAHYASADGKYGLDSMLPMMLPHVNGHMARTGDLPRVWTPITSTWTGGVSSFWGNRRNWSSSAAPGDTFFPDGRVNAAASVLFDADTAARHEVWFDAERKVTGLTFRGGPSSSPFLLSGTGTLTLGEAGLRNEQGLAATIENPMRLRASQRWDVGSGGLNVAGAIDTGMSAENPFLLLLDGSGDTTLSGLVAGTGSLSKYGGGTLTLSGSQQWGDGAEVFVKEGTLRYDLASPAWFGHDNRLTIEPGATVVVAGSHSALGDGTDFVDLRVDGTLVVPDGASQVVGGLPGSGTVVVEGELTVFLDGGSTATTGATTGGGAPAGPPRGGFSVVPEPSALLMLLGAAAAALAAALWRRRV